MRVNERGNVLVPGSTFSEEQYIAVDLRWLSLPLVLWLFVTVLLLLTIWRTASLGVPAWKTSSLPFLECVYPNNGVVSRKDVKQRAKNANITLIPDDKGWHLDVVR
jgi:hypothetical protein